MADESWKATVRRHRKEKDEAFRGHHSPLPEDQRDGFEGLDYFPVDAAYRLEVSLDRAEPETVEMPRTGGDAVAYVRIGTFTVDLPEGEATLAAYRREEEADELFLP